MAYPAERYDAERYDAAPAPMLADIVQAIKEEIIFGRLRPRERLVEGELSDRYRVSRHVIRSALTELQGMGLVARRHNKGAMVRDFSAEEVDEIYEVRAVLQREAILRIPWPPDRALVRELEAIHARYSRCVEDGDLKQVCSLNNTFHFTMFEAANNRCLSETIQRIWTETLGIRCYAIGDPVWLRRARDEHAAMVAEMAGGSRDGLLRLVDAHIWPALELYKRAHGGWHALGDAAWRGPKVGRGLGG